MRSVFAVILMMSLTAGLYWADCTGIDQDAIAAEQGRKQSSPPEPNDPPIGIPADLETFLTESEKRLAVNGQGIDALLEKIEETGPKALIFYGKKIRVLEQENLELQKMLHLYVIGEELPLQETRVIFLHDIDRLGRSIERLLAEQW